MPVEQRRTMNALNRANLGEYLRQMRQYRTSHPDECERIIRAHNAGGPSPGILRFIREVIMNVPNPNVPRQPANFPKYQRIDHHPGRHRADVHLEGRALDFYIEYSDPDKRVYGDWLFDYCVINCVQYRIQGVIYGHRQWFSETNNGQIVPHRDTNHENHVHIELNCDGANLR